MLVKNFPVRIERRKLRAQMPKDEKIEPIFDGFRDIRTKKLRHDKKNKVTI